MSDDVHKELTHFWDAEGEYEHIYSPSVATDKFLERNIVIPRADLPKCEVVEQGGETHVDCGADWGTWKIQNVDRMRTTALDYLAVWVTAEAWHTERASKESARDKRREELAKELWPFTGCYGPLSSFARNAIDRIISLEEGK